MQNAFYYLFSSILSLLNIFVIICLWFHNLFLTSTLQVTTFLCFTMNSSQLGKQKEQIFGQWHWMPPTLDFQYSPRTPTCHLAISLPSSWSIFLPFEYCKAIILTIDQLKYLSQQIFLSGWNRRVTMILHWYMMYITLQVQYPCHIHKI